jgi:hypothetical protein
VVTPIGLVVTAVEWTPNISKLRRHSEGGVGGAGRAEKLRAQLRIDADRCVTISYDY